jgi:hypothetical protein
MIYQHSAMILELSRKNPDLNFGLGVVNETFTPLFDFKQWKRAKSYESKRKLVQRAVSNMWKGGNGIAGTAVLEGLSKIEFPQASGKKTYNLVQVFTDGQECAGKAEGEELKQQIRDFREARHELQKSHKGKKRQCIDMVFTGIGLGNEPQDMPKHYPCYIILPGKVSADAYLEALFKIAFMQTKKRLDGDLSSQLKGLRGERVSPVSGFVPSALFVKQSYQITRNSGLVALPLPGERETVKTASAGNPLLNDFRRASAKDIDTPAKTNETVELPKTRKAILNPRKGEIINTAA